MLDAQDFRRWLICVRRSCGLFCWQLHYSAHLTFYHKDLRYAPFIRYLGVCLDSKPHFTTHVDDVCNRAVSRLLQIRKLSNRLFGTAPWITRRLITACCYPMVTYASACWAHRSSLQTVRAKLSRVTRLASLLVTGCSRSASSDVLLSLAGLPESPSQITQSLIHFSLQLITTHTQLHPTATLSPSSVLLAEDRRMLASGVVDHDHRTVFTEVLLSRSGRSRFRSQAQVYVRLFTSRQWNNCDALSRLKSFGVTPSLDLLSAFPLSRRQFTIVCPFLADTLPTPAFFQHLRLQDHSYCQHCQARFADSDHLLNCPFSLSHNPPTDLPDCQSDLIYFLPPLAEFLLSISNCLSAPD